MVGLCNIPSNRHTMSCYAPKAPNLPLYLENSCWQSPKPAVRCRNMLSSCRHEAPNDAAGPDDTRVWFMVHEDDLMMMLLMMLVMIMMTDEGMNMNTRSSVGLPSQATGGCPIDHYETRTPPTANIAHSPQGSLLSCHLSICGARRPGYQMHCRPKMQRLEGSQGVHRAGSGLAASSVRWFHGQAIFSSPRKLQRDKKDEGCDGNAAECSLTLCLKTRLGPSSTSGRPDLEKILLIPKCRPPS